MKEATGELSTTVIAVVAIAAIAALFTALLLPTLRTNILRRTHCSTADCQACVDGKMECVYYTEEDGEDEGKPITCPCEETNK